ncbi:MAG: SgcJ/EcaC family oxidoreductase [Massilia sp.]|nr:SgcJ/EcaC family oxidoreductase [Massilia sp.]
MSDEQAIRRLIERWIEATRNADVEAVLGLMAPDVVFLQPGQAPMEGRDAFASSLRGALGENTIDSVSEIDEITVSGDMAYCRTRLAVTIISKHGKLPLQRTGHTLSILRKGSDGNWLLTRDANMLSASV